MSKLFSAALAIAALSVVSLGSLETHSIEIGSAASANPPQRIRWRPNPTLGSAQSTLSGGRRGQAIARCEVSQTAQPATLTLLVPQSNQSLLTTAANPTFSWHTETAQPMTARFVLSDPNTAEPIFTQTVNIDRAGISRVALPAEFALKAGVRYRWTVLLACDGGAKEVVARSFVERVEKADLQQRAGSQSAIDRASSFAAAGIWYDAITALLDAAQQDPNNAQVKMELRSLLSQVGRPSIEVAQVMQAMFRS